MSHPDPLTLGLETVRVAALVALLRPDLVLKHPRHVIRRAALRGYLATRSRTEQPVDVPVTPAPR